VVGARPTFDSARLQQALGDLLPVGWLRFGPVVTVLLAGEIRESGSLADIVSFLAQSGRCGTLVVASKQDLRAMTIERGELVSVATTVASERIGELLHRTAAVDHDAIDDSSVLAAIDGTPLGEALLAGGFIDRASLDAALRRQVEEVFFAALRASDGAFAFVDETLPAIGVPGERSSLLSLLMEGARRADELTVYRESVPSPRHVPMRLAAPDASRLSERHARVLGLCDGGHNVDEIGHEAGLLEFELTETLHALVKQGLVRVCEPARQPPHVRRRSRRQKAAFCDSR
jgi:hypothetical protein